MRNVLLGSECRRARWTRHPRLGIGGVVFTQWPTHESNSRRLLSTREQLEGAARGTALFKRSVATRANERAAQYEALATSSCSQLGRTALDHVLDPYRRPS
jgi:hypothetical protein